MSLLGSAFIKGLDEPALTAWRADLDVRVEGAERDPRWGFAASATLPGLLAQACVRAWVEAQGVATADNFGPWDCLWSNPSLLSGPRATERAFGLAPIAP